MERSYSLNAAAEGNLKRKETRPALILVNWCQPVRTIEAVHAAMKQTQECRIIVVDNGSHDNSLDRLQELLPAGVKLIARNVNGGFGAGVNEGLREARLGRAKYIWLLNNDAMPERDCLEKLVLVAKSDTLIGAVGARIIDPSGSIPDHAGTIMSSSLLNCKYSLSSEDMRQAEYSWITGACMLLKINALNQIGEFDERFFMYWEDADLCCRLRKAGYKFGVATNAIVFHQAGSSSEKIQLRRYEWHINSQSLYVKKHVQRKMKGVILVYLKSFAKSLLDLRMDRFSLTAQCFWKRILKKS
jgi:GT2 family glycosyltransferase